MEVLWRMMMMMATRGWWRWTPPSLSDQHWSGLGALMLSQKQEEKQDKPVIPPTLSTYGAFFVRLKITVHCFMCKSTALLLISLLLLIAVCRGLIIGADLSPRCSMMCACAKRSRSFLPRPYQLYARRYFR